MNTLYIILYLLYAFGQAIVVERITTPRPSDREAESVLMMALVAPLLSLILVVWVVFVLIELLLGKAPNL